MNDKSTPPFGNTSWLPAIAIGPKLLTTSLVIQIRQLHCSIDKAKTYKDCIKIIEETVKPERMTNNRKERRERWWQYNPDNSDAEIRKLRELHVEMDQAVAVAYGWADLELGHGFQDTKQGVRFTISESARLEVLQGRLELNHERYAEELKQGLHEKKKPGKTPKVRKANQDQGLLFD